VKASLLNLVGEYGIAARDGDMNRLVAALDEIERRVGAMRQAARDVAPHSTSRTILNALDGTE
jgi:hypothetical protein